MRRNHILFCLIIIFFSLFFLPLIICFTLRSLIEQNRFFLIFYYKSERKKKDRKFCAFSIFFLSVVFDFCFCSYIIFIPTLFLIETILDYSHRYYFRKEHRKREIGLRFWAWIDGYWTYIFSEKIDNCKCTRSKHISIGTRAQPVLLSFYSNQALFLGDAFFKGFQKWCYWRASPGYTFFFFLSCFFLVAFSFLFLYFSFYSFSSLCIVPSAFILYAFSRYFLFRLFSLLFFFLSVLLFYFLLFFL